jgi:calcium-dependent protein kinase
LLKRSVLRLLGDQLRKDDPNAGPGVEGVIDGVLAEERNLTKARSIHWSPYDPVGVVNADP